MCHLFLKMCPQMCPQMSLDYGALLWTLSHFQLKTREGKKKKAGRLCTFAALNLQDKNRTRHTSFSAEIHIAFPMSSPGDHR
ncbi:hypothetical protein DFO48_10373 [Comamonas sp. AG1104]|nr:hypothetical protein DFO48_10373 [Comamonas sp. AG1104]